MARRKIGTAHSCFCADIDRLVRLDQQNQSRYRVGPGRPSSGALTKTQMIVLTEGVLLNAFRCYERFIEEVFILYALGRTSRSGAVAKPFIRPKNADHAVELIQSSMNFLEWNSPETIVRRAERYLRDGYPIKSAITADLSLLNDLRWIRNHIAHNSRESHTRYTKVVHRSLGILPLQIPPAGEFLLLTVPNDPSSYFLLTYLRGLKRVADALTA